MFQAIYAQNAGSSIYSRIYFDRPADGLYRHKYIIEDTKFVEEWEGACGQVIYNTLVRPGAVIKCYEAKHENVAFELAMYHKYMKKTYRWYELEKEIEYDIEWTPDYREYADKVRKYLSDFNSFKAFW
jgi:hypothetical protein